MPSITVENYLKRLLQEQNRTGEALIPMGQLATSVNVTPSSATSMAKTLAAADLIEYLPRIGVRLTEAGSKIALGVLRRHRLIELFLVEILGLDWSQVHEEAEVIEHAISELVLDRIDALLGKPCVDPHGDPIPTPSGGLDLLRPLKSLAECKIGRHMLVRRIMNQDRDFLRFVDQTGLIPGTRVLVYSRDPMADTISVQLEGGLEVNLGHAPAEKILVECQEEE